MSAAFTSRSTRGISLLELMLSLLIIAIILLTATRYFNVANENARVAEAAQMVNTVVAASYKWVEGMPNFSGDGQPISILVLRNAGLLPANFTNPSNNQCGLNPWKADICVAPAQDIQKIVITLENVPSKSCENLRQKLLQAAPDANCFIDLQSGQAKFTATF